MNYIQKKSMKISDKTFVAVSYKLNVGEGDELELMEEATSEQPLSFIFGTGSMLPSFEEKLAGLATGDKFSFSLKAEEAYGDFNEDYVIELPKSVFEVDGKFDNDQVFEGNTLPMMDSNGNRMSGSVLEIKEDVVVMNFNHPLAGETLNFDGEVLDVHDATPEEIAAMTAGGCSCGSGCDCESGHEHGDACGCGSGSKEQSGCGCGCH